jgi:cytochrome c oxidase subunit 4
MTAEHLTRPESSPMKQGISAAAYIVIFIALLALLGVAVAVTFIPYDRLGVPGLGVLVALSIAAAKAYLVALYFMHLKLESRLIQVVALAGLFWLAILFVLTLNDYLTRGWFPLTSGWREEAILPPP